MSNANTLSERRPAYPIDPVFVKRWSPRSFLDKAVPEEEIMSLLEAARWAPSAFNLQPWRFIVLQGEDRERLYPSISEFNLTWCKKAPVLILILSDTLRDGEENYSHAFDTGAAWGSLALAAAMQGLVTHPMTGFDFKMARESMQIPEQYAIQALVAVGYQGPASGLPEQLQARETPNQRHPIEQFVYRGRFGRPIGGDAR